MASHLNFANRLPLSVWVLSDGKPGHFNQARGVVRALEFHFDVQAQWIDLRLRFNGFRRPMELLLNSTHRKLSLKMLSWFYHVPKLPEASPDLIVSAGGNTLFPNAWLARCLDVRNLFVGNVRRLGGRHFWRVLTYLDSQAGLPFIQWPITPVPILPEEVQQQGDELRHQNGWGSERLWTCLIGGEGGGYHYQERDWRKLANAMNRLSREHAIRWLVVTSRRTGLEGESVLREHLSSPHVADAAWYSEEQGQRYFSLLGAANAVWVTEDSHMMITESISAGKPTMTLRPSRFDPHWTNQKYLDMYATEGWIARHDILQLASGEASPLSWPTPMQITPLRELGDLLASLMPNKAA